MTFNTRAENLLVEARLDTGPSQRLIKYFETPLLRREKRQYREFVTVDLAHTTMLVEEGILDVAAGRKILHQLLRLRNLAAEDFPTDAAKGSFLLQVESHLFAAIGEEVGGRMHTGRSRIDQSATVRRLYKRNRLLEVFERLNDFQAVLTDTASRYARSVMPGYTHMQHAQPWVFGHYLLSFHTRLHDDFERMTQAYARVNRNPLGTVGLAGTSWPLNRKRTTELLGFDALLENAKLGRESWYAAEAISALSFVMADLNDLATDLHLWSTQEFGFVELNDGYCGTSSIFPQKKNPVALEAIKKAAGEAVTWLATALATFRCEGTGDQAMREVPLIDGALQTTADMLDLFTGILDTLIVHEDRMAAALAGSWCTTSSLADTIVRETGLSFRQAHHIVARVVRESLAAGIRPGDLTAAALDRLAQDTQGAPLGLTDTMVRDALDPHRFVETRVTTGSVAPAEVDRMLAHARIEVGADRAWIVTARARLADAETALEHAITAILTTDA